MLIVPYAMWSDRKHSLAECLMFVAFNMLQPYYGYSGVCNQDLLRAVRWAFKKKRVYRETPGGELVAIDRIKDEELVAATKIAFNLPETPSGCECPEWKEKFHE